jgi:hypothetical protein
MARLTSQVQGGLKPSPHREGARSTQGSVTPQPIPSDVTIKDETLVSRSGAERSDTDVPLEDTASDYPTVNWNTDTSGPGEGVAEPRNGKSKLVTVRDAVTTATRNSADGTSSLESKDQRLRGDSSPGERTWPVAQSISDTFPERRDPQNSWTPRTISLSPGDSEQLELLRNDDGLTELSVQGAEGNSRLSGEDDDELEISTLSNSVSPESLDTGRPHFGQINDTVWQYWEGIRDSLENLLRGYLSEHNAPREIAINLVEFGLTAETTKPVVGAFSNPGSRELIKTFFQKPSIKKLLSIDDSGLKLELMMVEHPHPTFNGYIEHLRQQDEELMRGSSSERVSRLPIQDVRDHLMNAADGSPGDGLHEVVSSGVTSSMKARAPATPATCWEDEDGSYLSEDSDEVPDNHVNMHVRFLSTEPDVWPNWVTVRTIIENRWRAHLSNHDTPYALTLIAVKFVDSNETTTYALSIGCLVGSLSLVLDFFQQPSIVAVLEEGTNGQKVNIIASHDVLTVYDFRSSYRKTVQGTALIRGGLVRVFANSHSLDNLHAGHGLSMVEDLADKSSEHALAGGSDHTAMYKKELTSATYSELSANDELLQPSLRAQQPTSTILNGQQHDEDETFSREHLFAQLLVEELEDMQNSACNKESTGTAALHDTEVIQSTSEARPASTLSGTKELVACKRVVSDVLDLLIVEETRSFAKSDLIQKLHSLENALAQLSSIHGNIEKQTIRYIRSELAEREEALRMIVAKLEKSRLGGYATTSEDFRVVCRDREFDVKELQRDLDATADSINAFVASNGRISLQFIKFGYPLRFSEATGQDSSVTVIDQNQDDMSDGRSVNSDVESIFSAGFAQSVTSGLSAASGFSTMQIETATKELLHVFLEDQALASFYTAAIEHPGIGPTRLQRNIERLLKAFARDLRSEAEQELEKLASRLVSAKCSYVAQAIIDRYEVRPSLDLALVSWLPPITHQREDSSDEDEEEADEGRTDEPVDEDLIEDLFAFRRILAGDEAFAKFRRRLEAFVSPKSMEVKTDLTTDELSLHKGVIPSSEHAIPGGQVEGEARPAVWKRIRSMTAHLLSAAGLLEPPLDCGWVRLRWQCVS